MPQTGAPGDPTPGAFGACNGAAGRGADAAPPRDHQPVGIQAVHILAHRRFERRVGVLEPGQPDPSAAAAQDDSRAAASA
jgi:hypothetical protein